MEPRVPAEEVQRLSHWTTREVPGMALTGRKQGTARGRKVAVEVVTASKQGRTQEVSGIRGIKEKGAEKRRGATCLSPRRKPGRQNELTS